MAIYHLSNNGDYVIDSSQQWVIKMMVVLAMASGDLQVLSQQGSLKIFKSCTALSGFPSL